MKRESANVHLAFRKSDNLRFKFLLCFAPEFEFLHRCGHYFFDHRLRVYLPLGYEENTLAHYPLAYMQDGQNLFFPHEAFQHKDWQVDQTSQVLRTIRAIEDLIIHWGLFQ